MDRDELSEKVRTLLEESPDRRFTESVELAVNLKNIDLSDPSNRVEDEVVLPNGRGKRARVGLFGSGEMAVQARDVADLILEPEELEDLADEEKQAKKIAGDIDFFLAEAPLMPTIGRTLGPILGPRGKMPDPIQPGEDPAERIESLHDTTRMRSRENRTFHVYVGSRDMDPDLLAENVDTVVDRLTRSLERREHNIDSIYVTTTMGGSVRIQ